MNIFKLLLAEIRYRKLNFALSLFAVMIAVALFVAGPILIEGYGRETNARLHDLDDKTRLYMRDMGFNLMVVHRDTNMSDFWADGFASKTMPQEYVERLASDERLTMVTHLVATLQQKITWHDRKVLLIGYLPETPQLYKPKTKFAERREQARKKKLPMGENIQRGSVRLGYELGAGKKKEETIEVQYKHQKTTFRIDQIAPEKGSIEDIAIKMHLSDAQQLLGKPKQINQILALECRCDVDDLPVIRQQLEQVLPEARVTEYRSIAVARSKQREEVKINRETQQGLMELLASVMTLLVVLACAVWVGLLTLANVRERRTEIGILRALGKGSGTIASLFLGKAVLLGILGAAVGFVLGSVLAEVLGVWVLEVAADRFTIHYDVMLVALLGAPLLSAVAGYLPTLSALSQDPAVVLRDH